MIRSRKNVEWFVVAVAFGLWLLLQNVPGATLPFGVAAVVLLAVAVGRSAIRDRRPGWVWGLLWSLMVAALIGGSILGFASSWRI